MVKLKWILSGLVIALVLTTLMLETVSAADVTAQLDRKKLVEGETVTLVLRTDDPQQSLDTDLASLSRDFHVVDQRSETQMSIVNGRQTSVVRLVVTLEPKRTGVLRVPEMSFAGGARTAPMTVEVEAAPELAPGEVPPVFIELELEPGEGPYYVHAQMSLKVRIYYQQNLTEAAINPPAPEQASVRLLDEVPYQADRNGNRFKVLERRYAIFPERSGEMVIPPMQLTGRLIERPADRLWQPTVRGRRVRVESEPLALEIQPRPADFNGDYWLPARRIELAQSITDGDSIRVGEPVTRTVLMDAVGLEEHMLEEPVWPEMENVRVYPDQPQGISRDDGEWVLGHREFRYAVVPETEGDLVLPEIRVHWWDTVADRERVAVLPEHRVTVLPPEQGGMPVLISDQLSSTVTGQESGGAGSAGPGQLAWKVLTGLFAGLWVLTLLLYFRKRPVSDPQVARSREVAAGEAELLKGFKDACRRGDARAARHQLSSWTRHFGPGWAEGSLLILARKSGHATFASEIQALDESGFRTGGESGWNGRSLQTAFEEWRSNQDARNADADVNGFNLYAAAREA